MMGIEIRRTKRFRILRIMAFACLPVRTGWAGFIPRPEALPGQGPVDRAPAPIVENGRRLEEFNLIASKIESVYSHLKSKEKTYGFSYPKLRERYRERVRGSETEEDYRAALNGFLDAFHDPHLQVTFSGAFPSGPARSSPPAVVNSWADGGILVTRINRLWGNEVDIVGGLEESLRLAKGAKALIVDLRGNGGGSSGFAREYVSRLVAREIPLGRVSVRISKESRAKYGELRPDPKRPGFSAWEKDTILPRTGESFPGPIGVLIDGDCASSCEGTAMMFKFSGAATLYGSRTKGSSGNPVELPLAASMGRLRVPTWIRIMPDGNSIEDHGLLPDVPVGAPRDALDAALADIRGKLARQCRRTLRHGEG
jgi:C-terminal processing protease CtpA/Prc